MDASSVEIPGQHLWSLGAPLERGLVRVPSVQGAKAWYLWLGQQARQRMDLAPAQQAPVPASVPLPPPGLGSCREAARGTRPSPVGLTWGTATLPGRLQRRWSSTLWLSQPNQSCIPGTSRPLARVLPAPSPLLPASPAPPPLPGEPPRRPSQPRRALLALRPSARPFSAAPRSPLLPWKGKTSPQ